MKKEQIIKSDTEALELATAINSADYEHCLWKQAMSDYRSRIAKQSIEISRNNGTQIGRPPFPEQENGQEILNIIKDGRKKNVKWRELVDIIEEKFDHRYAKSSLHGYHEKYNS
jgi:hypothetical protein